MKELCPWNKKVSFSFALIFTLFSEEGFCSDPELGNRFPCNPPSKAKGETRKFNTVRELFEDLEPRELRKALTHKNVQQRGDLSLEDKRTSVEKTKTFPYSAQALFITKFPTQNRYTYTIGSGTFIHPEVILTAAHNLYNIEGKDTTEKFYNSIGCFPAIHKRKLYFGKPHVLGFKIAEEYRYDKDYTYKNLQDHKKELKNFNEEVDAFRRQHDYALVFIDPQSHIGRTGNLGVWMTTGDQLKDQEVWIAGYPIENFQDCEPAMWKMPGKVVSLTPSDELLHYKIYASEGQSGSGVYYEQGDEYFVVGVHAYGTGDGKYSYNHGPRITKEKGQKILQWIEEFQKIKGDGELRQKFFYNRPAKPVNEEGLPISLVRKVEQGEQKEKRKAQFKISLRYKNGQGVKQDPAKALKWLKLAAKGNDGYPEAQYELAMMHQKEEGGIEKSTEKALELLKKAADREDAYPKAQYELAMMYQKEDGGAKKFLKWLKKAADKNHKEAQLKLGMMYRDGQSVEQDEKQAFDWIKKAAASQSNQDAQDTLADAQYMLGVMYRDGVGVGQSDAEAITWFQKAADQGNEEAQLHLQAMLTRTQSIDQNNVEIVKEKADQGNMEAQFELGNIYMAGQGVKQDDIEAIKWYQKAAEQGHVLARNNLSLMYAKGRGVEKNDAKAVEWYRKAAKQGHVLAQNNLALMYAKACGVEKNDVEALKWFQRAASQGHVLAQNNLALMYAKGRGVEKNDVEALKWYQKAAEQGHVLAQNNLALMYAKGHGAKKNDVKARKWFQKAAEKHDARAQNRLALMYAKGHGVKKKNNAEALKWFQRAANQGHVRARNNLALMYAKGRGVEKNNIEVLKWLQEAAKKGDKRAQNKLVLIYAKGRGVEKNNIEVLGWLLEAAEKGDKRAQNKLALIYAKSRGAKKNNVEALKGYRKAAKQGHATRTSGYNRIKIHGYTTRTSAYNRITTHGYTIKLND